MSYIYRFEDPPAAAPPVPAECAECKRGPVGLNAAGAKVIVCRRCFRHACTQCTEAHEARREGTIGRTPSKRSPCAVLELRTNTVWRVCRHCLPASGGYPVAATAASANVVVVRASVHGTELESRVCHAFNAFRLEQSAFAPSAAVTRQLGKRFVDEALSDYLPLLSAVPAS